MQQWNLMLNHDEQRWTIKLSRQYLEYANRNSCKSWWALTARTTINYFSKLE